jgi:hypothetical protein
VLILFKGVIEMIRIKIVGLKYNNLSKPIEEKESIVIMEDMENAVDCDAIIAKTLDGDATIGYVANSPQTLSKNNKINGCVSATELNFMVNLQNRRYYATVEKSLKSCVYAYVDEDKFDDLSSPSDEISIKLESLSIENELLALKLNELQSSVNNLEQKIAALESRGNEENVPITSEKERMLYAVVGLSHFTGQNHLEGKLSIVEEPIYPNAKGTALYLKVGNERLGVFPSERKKAYCEEHKIPYYENKRLKNMDLTGEIRLEELVYDEYAIISI